MISIEQAYINTNHPDFFGGGSTAIELVEKLTIQEKQNQQREKEEKIKQQTPQQKGQDVKKVEQPKQQNQSDLYSQTFNDRENMEMNIIKALLGAYFSITRKNVCDSVPKAIMHFLVNK